MVVLIFEWEKTSGFQLLVSGFLFPLSKKTNYNKFWDYVRKQTIKKSQDISSHFIIFYILNKTKTYNLYNPGGFGYHWVDFRKSNMPISIRLKSKKCDWQSDDPQRPALLTKFRIRLFGLNRFVDFCPPLGKIKWVEKIKKRERESIENSIISYIFLTTRNISHIIIRNVQDGINPKT
jgi:hypothetical protein